MGFRALERLTCGALRRINTWFSILLVKDIIMYMSWQKGLDNMLRRDTLRLGRVCVAIPAVIFPVLLGANPSRYVMNV